MWKNNAIIVETVYGGYVDWEERFYICPECDEPIYEDDYPDAHILCPVCGFDDDEN